MRKELALGDSTSDEDRLEMDDLEQDSTIHETACPLPNIGQRTHAENLKSTHAEKLSRPKQKRVMTTTMTSTTTGTITTTTTTTTMANTTATITATTTQQQRQQQQQQPLQHQQQVRQQQLPLLRLPLPPLLRIPLQLRQQFQYSDLYFESSSICWQSLF